ncbi:unnamed protein product [Caretta caretta]
MFYWGVGFVPHWIRGLKLLEFPAKIMKSDGAAEIPHPTGRWNWEAEMVQELLWGIQTATILPETEEEETEAGSLLYAKGENRRYVCRRYPLCVNFGSTIWPFVYTHITD